MLISIVVLCVLLGMTMSYICLQLFIAEHSDLLPECQAFPVSWWEDKVTDIKIGASSTRTKTLLRGSS